MPHANLSLQRPAVLTKSSELPRLVEQSEYQQLETYYMGMRLHLGTAKTRAQASEASETYVHTYIHTYVLYAQATVATE